MRRIFREFKFFEYSPYNEVSPRPEGFWQFGGSMGLFDRFRKKPEQKSEPEEELLTAHQARKAWQLYSNVPDKRSEILKKWNLIILPDLEEIIRANNENGFFALLFNGDFPHGGEANALARKNIESMALLIKTPEQAKKIVKNCGHASFLGVENIVTQRWEDLSLSEVEKASNISEIENAAGKSLYNGKAFKAAIPKWASHCQTLLDITYLKDSANKMGGPCTLSFEVKAAIDLRMESILFVEIPTNTSKEMAKLYYSCAPRESISKLLAFDKWISLCKSLEEVEEAYAHREANHMYTELAFKRAKEIISPH